MHENGRAIAAMLAAMAGFILNDTLVKLTSDGLALGQIIFVRGLICIGLIVAFGLFTGLFREMHRFRHPAVLVRAGAETAATLFYLSALFQLPIANATAILQSLPLIVTAGAALLLGNHVGWRRWTAIGIGFCGVLMIVRPGLAGFNAYSLLALAGVGCMALRDLATRKLPADVPTLGVALVTFVAVTLLGFGLTVADGWQPITVPVFIHLAGAAVFVMAGYIFIILAMRLGDVAVVAPFRYSIVIWAICIGYLVWGDVPDMMTLAGTAVVVVMGIYAFWREMRLTRRETGN